MAAGDGLQDPQQLNQGQNRRQSCLTCSAGTQRPLHIIYVYISESFLHETQLSVYCVHKHIGGSLVGFHYRASRSKCSLDCTAAHFLTQDTESVQLKGMHHNRNLNNLAKKEKKTE